MGLSAGIRQFVVRRVIQMALVKRSGPSIPTSGDEARNNDIYLFDSEGVARILVYNLVGDKVQGKWSLNGQNFTEERSLGIAELADFQPWIQHYYRGGTFYTIGITKFLCYRWCYWPWIHGEIRPIPAVSFQQAGATPAGSDEGATLHPFRDR